MWNTCKKLKIKVENYTTIVTGQLSGFLWTVVERQPRYSLTKFKIGQAILVVMPYIFINFENNLKLEFSAIYIFWPHNHILC